VYPFERITALGPFREPLRKIVHQMKYHHRWPVAEILADQMLNQPAIRRILDHTDVLVPIPLHWSRQILRGYNQSETLARRLSRRHHRLQIARPIVRLKNTFAQTAIRSFADRAFNLRHAFGLVNPKSIRDKRVTLVDDVMTTAATLKAAARAIQDADPIAINAVVLSVADPRRADFQAV
jgi:ComF family protein